MRTYADSPRCPDCGRIPQRNLFDSRWTCGCEGREWPRLRSVRGCPEEHDKLTKARFVMQTDSLGDTCYCYPSTSNPKIVVWLYENDTWRSEPDTAYPDFDNYLEQLPAA